MTDRRVRELEREVAAARASRTFSWELQERLEAERIRAGGRDPRVDPRAGDYLAGKTTRDVVAVWPRALAEPVCAFAYDERSTGDATPIWLPAGVVVDCLRETVNAWLRGEVDAQPSREHEVTFLAVLKGEWVRFRTWGHEQLPDVDGYLPLAPGPGGLPVSEVAFRRDDRRLVEKVRLDLWRRWARRARVRRTAVLIAERP